MSIKIAAVVVIYNPDKKFINNIYTYFNQVSLLIIIDNSENTDTSFYETLQDDERIKFIINNENTGIAKAINTGVQLAASNGFQWALTMDQDSFFEKKMIEKYFEEFNSLPEKNKVAVIGPVTDKAEDNNSTGKIKKVTSLITSGSLINTLIFTRAGGYNEKLFIDEVDHEYCYRANLLGYSILQFKDVLLEHSLGSQLSVKTISGKNKIKSFHSPVRLYYIVRNCCYIISVYKSLFPEEIKLKRKDLLVRIKNNLLYGPKKLSSLKYIIRGFIHYKRNRFGKL